MIIKQTGQGMHVRYHRAAFVFSILAFLWTLIGVVIGGGVVRRWLAYAAI